MILDQTTRKLQVILGEAKTTNDCPVVSAYFDSATVPTAATTVVNSNGVTAVDIVPAPGASTIRQVNEISFFNADTVSHNVTVRYNDNGTTYVIRKVVLLTGEMLCYSKSGGWYCLDASGNVKESLSGTTANLTDFATGTWTPTDASGGGLTFTSPGGCSYMKISNRYFIKFSVLWPSTADTHANAIGGLPGTSGGGGGAVSFTTFGASTWTVFIGSGTIQLNKDSTTQSTNAVLSGSRFDGIGFYTG